MAEKHPQHRILIADDARDAAASLAQALESAGFDCEVAVDGQECFRLARSFRPHVLLLDLIMPKIHGIDVLKRLKADPATSRIGVLVCAAKGAESELVRAITLGAQDMILKPFDHDALIAKVRAMLPKGDAGLAEAGAAAPGAGAGPFMPKIDPGAHYVRLWGTRGSIPVSNPSTVRHGGNTTCMQLHCGDEVIIFDAGSGIRELGDALLAGKARKLHLFMTHTHWDHIQGFPFFAPAYHPEFELTIYSAKGFSKDLSSVFRGQLDVDYFPVQMDDMRARLKFKELPVGALEMQGMSLTWEYAQHPGATVGYRIEVGGRSVAFVPDNEFLKGFLGSHDQIGADPDMLEIYQPMIDHLQGVDVLIHEAQYTQDEYVNKIGWGHTSVANACSLCKLTSPKQWIVTHHDPGHSDDMLQNKLNLTRQILRDLDCATEVRHGFDGLIDSL